MTAILIYRGLPGAGKTTRARSLLSRSHLLVSADLYFTKDGKYMFDASKIGEAHAWCFVTFLDSLNSPTRPERIVVDNTNISAWEIAPYVLAASAHELNASIITIWCEPQVAIARNIHNVPPTTIFSMYQRLLREELPSFWRHEILYP